MRAKPEIILASGSPRRKQLFEMMGLQFSVQPSSVEEPRRQNGQEPADYALELAQKKARDVARKNPGYLTIGADTIVNIGDEVLGKPESFSEAVEMLEQLSGKSHEVITAVSAVICDKQGNIHRETAFHVSTEVIFSTLTRREIERYVDSGSPMDKAGAYGIQDDRGALFVSGIKGDYYNVVGFPVNRFYQEMKVFFPALFDF